MSKWVLVLGVLAQIGCVDQCWNCVRSVGIGDVLEMG
jgi:hypothetical protein